MRILVYILILSLPLPVYSQARRAQSMIEKDRKTEAYELLVRSISKDSLASAEHYLLARLYIDIEYEIYQIDSAYAHINQAIADFAGLDQKQQDKLQGSGFSPIGYESLKDTIEMAGFARAKNTGTESDYISFINDFPQSVREDSAIYFRDMQAFINASRMNTYSAYKNFFDTYPEAVDEQEARNRYEQLLYLDKTKSGKLADYQFFLREYPNTWHRNEAEWEIFRILTGKNSIEGYQQFINGYPESINANLANILLYNCLYGKDRMAFLDSKNFSQRQLDSLKEISTLQAKLLLLSRDELGYLVIDSAGNAILKGMAEPSQQSRCSNEIDLLLVSNDNNGKLINIAGQSICEGDILDFKIEKNGIIRITRPGGIEFRHSNGRPTSGRLYNEAIMAGPFIAYKEHEKWGLQSITGIQMLKPQLDSITTFHDQLLVISDGKWGILSYAAFYPLLDQGSLKLHLQYDLIEEAGEQQYLVEQEGKTGLIDKQGKILIPIRTQSIEVLEEGYFLETNDSILDSRLANTWYRDIHFNQKWTYGERKKELDIYYEGLKVFTATHAELIGNSAILVTRNDSTYCYFTDSSKIIFNDGDEIKPIRKMGENSSLRHYIYAAKNKRPTVIDQNGRSVKMPRFDRLIDLGEEYMIFSVKGFVYNVLDNQGNVVLENVDAATSLDNGYISFLADGKFGLFNQSNDTYIESKYDKPIRNYTENLFIVNVQGSLGIIDSSDSVVLAPRYDEIIFFSDSLAIVKSNFRWQFWDLKRGTPVLDNVSNYWEYTIDGQKIFKVFSGTGYGIWSPEQGIILNSTYSEIDIRLVKNQIIYVAEKWVEEADLVILLYYTDKGGLFYKTILTSSQYEELQCGTEN